MRGLTRFVGRDAEIGALHASLERAASGRGQIAALVGEPGVGKSRLVWELTHSHRTDGWLVLESGSVSYGKATSWLPVIDLLKAYCRIEARDDPRTVREKLAGKLLMLDRTLKPTLPALLALLDVPVDDPTWDALEPAPRRRATLDGVKRVLLRESQEQPLLLVLEDLHWIDSESQALLDSLVESLPTARIFLLVNHRPEYGHGWGGRAAYTQLRIDALAHEGAEALLASLLGDDPSLEPLKRRLLERTEGTPLFLEESVRSLVETGALVGDRGTYRLTAPVLEIQVPATVQAVLAARIDRLPPEEKRLLQIAAVIGKDVPDALLRAIVERGENALRRGLAGLQGAEFLYEASLFPELEYTFKHALTHEVAYGSLLQERRKALHASVVSAMEELYADRLDEHIDRLAYHAMRAEFWTLGVTYGRLAGLRAIARAAYRAAETQLDQALVAFGHLPSSRATRELGVDLRTDFREALMPISGYTRLLQLMSEAEVIATELDDHGRLGLIYTHMSHCYVSLGQYDRALETCHQALNLAEGVGDAAIQVFAAIRLARLHAERGELRLAVDALRSRLGLLDDLPEVLPFGHSVSQFRGTYASDMARSLSDLGESDEAIRLGEEGIRWADITNRPDPMGVTRNITGLVLLTRGEVGRALPLLERARAILETADVPGSLPWSLGLLGATHTLAGRPADGVVLLEQAIKVADRFGTAFGYVLWIVWLAEAYLAVGRVADARQAAMRGLDLARSRNERRNEPYALRALGEIAAGSDPPDVETAEAGYRQALALAERQDQRPLQAHCHLGLGKLYRRVGRSDEARAELATAVEMLREMGMTFWLPDAEAELAQRDIEQPA